MCVWMRFMMSRLCPDISMWLWSTATFMIFCSAASRASTLFDFACIRMSTKSTRYSSMLSRTIIEARALKSLSSRTTATGAGKVEASCATASGRSLVSVYVRVACGPVRARRLRPKHTHADVEGAG